MREPATPMTTSTASRAAVVALSTFVHALRALLFVEMPTRMCRLLEHRRVVRVCESVVSEQAGRSLMWLRHRHATLSRNGYDVSDLPNIVAVVPSALHPPSHYCNSSDSDSAQPSAQHQHPHPPNIQRCSATPHKTSRDGDPVLTPVSLPHTVPIDTSRQCSSVRQHGTPSSPRKKIWEETHRKKAMRK